MGGQQEIKKAKKEIEEQEARRAHREVFEESADEPV